MTPWVTRLLIANAAMYLVTRTFPMVLPSLVLVPITLPSRPWTAVTYMFLHANFIHILFNMLVLYFFGPMLEMRLGSRRFLGLYFVSGIVAALVSLFFTPRAIIVGASGAVYGIMLGFARFWPRQQILIWGILPIQARWLVVVMTALSLYAGFSGSRDGVAHFAHLGGFLGGLLYLLWIEWRSPARRFKRKAEAGAPPVRDADSVAARWQSIRREQIHPLNREEVDRILDKVSRMGPSSLTIDERATLDRFAGKRSADN